MRLLRWVAGLGLARLLRGAALGLVAGARQLGRAADRREAKAEKLWPPAGGGRGAE